MRVGADKEYDMAMKFLQPAIGEVCHHLILPTTAYHTVSPPYRIRFLCAKFMEVRVFFGAGPSALIIFPAG